jgi:hypothetical protein
MFGNNQKTTRGKHPCPIRAGGCADITYVPTKEGWLYLAVVLDLFTRKIVGWAMRGHIRLRSVDRGARRPAIEPRKFPILGADTVHMVEGNILGRVSASARTTRRGQRPWHVQTLLAREPGDLAIDRSATAAGPHREGEEP